MQEALCPIRRVHGLVLAREGMRRGRTAVVFSPPCIGVPLLPLGSRKGGRDDADETHA